MGLRIFVMRPGKLASGGARTGPAQPRQRAPRVSFKQALVLFLAVAACSVLLLLEVIAVRRSSRLLRSPSPPVESSAAHQDTVAGLTEQHQQLPPLGTAVVADLSCPAPLVNWLAFKDPGPMFTGFAAIHATNWPATAPLAWLVFGLRQLGYAVGIYAYQEQLADAEAFAQLARAALHSKDTLVVSVREMPRYDPRTHPQHFRLDQPCNVFIYISASRLPDVPGPGTSANLLVMLPAADQQQQPSPAQGTSAAVAAAGVPYIVSGYDFLIYTSGGALVQHLPHVMPLMEQLQLSNQLFPLVDTVSLPAAPTSVPQADLGITFSMSSYGPPQRSLLKRALAEFGRVHAQLARGGSAAGTAKLIVCSWLLPGLEHDKAFLLTQVSALNLPRGSFEYRDDSQHMRNYTGVSMQWHLYNPEDKPHFTATAGMPAGVLVLDCTSVLDAQPRPKAGVHGACPSLDALHNVTLEHLEQPRFARVNKAIEVAQASSDAVGEAMRFKMLFLVHRSYTSKVFRFFIQSTQAAYRARLTPTVQHSRAQTISQGGPAAAATVATAAGSESGGKPASRYAAVIVEARPHYAFLYVVLNAAWYLPGWSLHVVHTRLNARFVRHVLQPHVKVTFHQLDMDNVDIDHYNLLMKNASFWQMFDADHVLLFQTDSLILRPGLERFTTFDYVGAPWHLENERWSQPALKAALPEGVGNGGFSMRSVQAMVDIINKHGPTSPLKEQEDVFFAVNMQSHPTFVLADRRTAYSFCLEVPCADVSMHLEPHALHAAWFYLDVPSVQRLLDVSLLGLRAALCV